MRPRAVLAVVVVVAWVAGSAVGAGSTGPAAHAAGLVLGKVRARFAPEPLGRRTIAILAVGSDARPGQDPLRSRGDSIHVILLHPRRNRATVVGIPRDSWVSIPGRGSNKINAALASGGPRLLAATIERNFRVRLDYWAVTSFWGTRRIVDAVGGLKVRIPFRMHDPFSGSNFRPGVRRLRGRQVLAFARDRKSVPAGDFGRQENGGRVFLAALEQFRTEFRRNPGRLLTWIGAGSRSIETDLSIGELIDLAFAALRVRGRVRNVVLPGGTGSAGGASVVFLSMSRARAIFTDAERDGSLRRGNVPRSPTGAGTTR